MVVTVWSHVDIWSHIPLLGNGESTGIFKWGMMKFEIWKEKWERDKGQVWWETFSEIKWMGSLSLCVGEDERRKEVGMTMMS